MANYEKNQLSGVKKCVCSKRDPSVFENKAGFIIGIVGNALLGLISLISIALYAFNVDKSWILLAGIWIAINLTDFIVSFAVRRSKGHTVMCSLRYAKINIFYSGVIF